MILSKMYELLHIANRSTFSNITKVEFVGDYADCNLRLNYKLEFISSSGKSPFLYFCAQDTFTI